MMELEAGLWGVVKAGYTLTLPSRKEAFFALTHNSQKQHSQPTLPQCTFIHTHPACIYNVPDSNGLAGKNKRHLQVCTIVHTGSMKRREIATSQNGDLTADVSMQFSTYIKTLTNKEKFLH